MIQPLTDAELRGYLARIGHAGALQPDLATLTALQRAHIAAIPFETTAMMLGDPPTLDPDRAYHRLVTNRLGGCCYEMNGLFGRVLATIGFVVTRLGACVRRDLRGDGFIGSHLCLKVSLERDYLVDVGFSGSMTEPMPLAEGSVWYEPFECSLSRTADGYWRFAEQAHGLDAFHYDFRDEPADEAELARLCHWQGHDPASVFMDTLILRRRVGAEHWGLRGKVLARLTAAGAETSLLRDADHLATVLRDTFALDLPQAAGLWPRIEARHAKLFS